MGTVVPASALPSWFASEAQTKLCLSCNRSFTGDRWLCPACGWQPAAGSFLEFAPDAEAADAFEQEGFEHLPDVEGESFWFRSRNQLIAWALRKYLPEARSLLEVGCGTGFVLAGLRRELPRLELAGGELSYAGLATARKRLPDVQLYQMDARSIPFDREFDVVCAFDVLEHVDDDEEAIRAMARATVDGGGVILTVPQHPSLWSAVDEYSRHRRRYTRKDLLHKLNRVGMTVVRATSFVSLLLPAMAASRLRQRRLAELDPLAEFSHPPRVDRALEHVMTLERSLITRGVSLPVGGSLLVVARRGAASV
jgi:SAM-dependent methyltransferase